MAHIPERMCIGCRQMRPKSELLRLVDVDGEIIVDSGQRIRARGVYLCPDEACINLARKKKALSRQFKRNISDAVYDELLK